MVKIKSKNKLIICIFFVLFIISNINFNVYCMLGNKIEGETQDDKEYKKKNEDNKETYEIFFFFLLQENNKNNEDICETNDSEDIITSIDDMLENKSKDEEDKKINHIVVIEGKQRFYYNYIEKDQNYDEDYIITSLEDIRK